MEYALNKDYIAEVLCINREKPEMDCDGKCYLMSNLENEMDQDAPAQKGSSRIQIEVILAYLQQPFSFSAYSDFTSVEQQFSECFLFNYKLLKLDRIESPPWKLLV